LLWASSFLILDNRSVVDALHSELKDLPMSRMRPA
jgi:hypothetical protein